MIDILPLVLLSFAAVVVVLIAYSLAHRVFTGQLTPMEFRELIELQKQENLELKRRNSILEGEREKERVVLLNALMESTKATFKITSFLDRYESWGGFATPQLTKKVVPPLED